MFRSDYYFTNNGNKIVWLIKLYFMQLNINKTVGFESTSKTTKINLNKHQLYNLLFGGKITLSEYIKALHGTKVNNKSNTLPDVM